MARIFVNADIKEARKRVIEGYYAGTERQLRKEFEQEAMQLVNDGRMDSRDVGEFIDRRWEKVKIEVQKEAEEVADSVEDWNIVADIVLDGGRIDDDTGDYAKKIQSAGERLMEYATVRIDGLSIPNVDKFTLKERYRRTLQQLQRANLREIERAFREVFTDEHASVDRIREYIVLSESWLGRFTTEMEQFLRDLTERHTLWDDYGKVAMIFQALSQHGFLVKMDPYTPLLKWNKTEPLLVYLFEILCRDGIVPEKSCVRMYDVISKSFLNKRGFRFNAHNLSVVSSKMKTDGNVDNPPPGHEELEALVKDCLKN